MFSGDRAERIQAMLPGKAEFESSLANDYLCEFKPSCSPSRNLGW